MNKLILFDIDGTLLTVGGAARRAFHRALVEIFGTAGPIDSHDFAGKTDPQIARELLTRAGLSREDVDHGLPALFDSYLRELDVELAANGAATVLPGVEDLLDALDRDDREPLLGLLTGNVAGGARRKLGAAGLADRFRFGVYGSDSESRPDLPALARRRAREVAGREYVGREVVIVGDTPHDVTCGRAIGVHAVGVATGSYEASALREAGADVVFENLSATDRVVDALFFA